MTDLVDFLREVKVDDTVTRGRVPASCRECGQFTRHLTTCWVFVDKLMNTLTQQLEQLEATRAAFIKYKKENPSRPQIKRLLERRAAHIVDLQAAGTRRNEQIESLTLQLEQALGERDSARRELSTDHRLTDHRRLRIDQLEAELFVLGNEKEWLERQLEQATADFERDQDILTQRIRELSHANQELLDRSVDLREWDETDLLTELSRRASQREKQ